MRLRFSAEVYLNGYFTAPHWFQPEEGGRPTGFELFSQTGEHVKSLML